VKGTECKYRETVQQDQVNWWATSNRGHVLREIERTRVRKEGHQGNARRSILVLPISQAENEALQTTVPGVV